MRFDTKNLNPGTKFYFNEDDKEQGYISLRVMTLAETERIAKETVKKERVFKKGTYHTIEKIDDDKRNKMIWDYVIMDWYNILDEDGNQIECNIDNKLMLFNNSPQFSQFILEKINLLNEQQDIESEVISGN